MEAAYSSMSMNDEERALKCLLDAFGSTFSLREIASAYKQAGKNSDMAGEILFTMHESSSSCITEEDMARNSSGSSNGNLSENSSQVDVNFKATKQKRCSSSMGSVASVIGKDYTRSTPLAYEPCITTKPLKLDSKEYPEAALWEDESGANSLPSVGVNKDMEDFLFKILGEGFNMDMPVIREVLASCGYDMQKSMDKILDLSIGTSTESNGYCSRQPKKFTDACPKPEPSSCENMLLHMNSSGRSKGNGGSMESGIENCRDEKRKVDLQNEVLAALFDGNARLQEPPRSASLKRAVVKKSRAFGEVVSEPYVDSTTEFNADLLVYTKKDYVEDEDGEYQVLRKAVKEHQETMKEYYKESVKVFVEGDHVLAGKLLDKGNFFRQKAREAEEKSAQLIFETCDVDEQEVFSLDLHNDCAKEAIRLLKCHLSSFGGLPSFKYLKVIVETNEPDTAKGARRKHIMKLLEKESIEWKEEGTPGTILICLQKINRKKLSFASPTNL